MKIEKINENQIRCTLTKEDLASRQLKLSELAYGTEKAKSLFRDMMQQANYEFGFEAEDIPLMIEAVPLNAECIVLIITKVEDPEELDTRFSRFAPSVHEAADSAEDENDTDSSEEIVDLFRKIQSTDALEKEDFTESTEIATDSKPPSRLFCFDTMHTILSMVSALCISFPGNSSLFKDTRSNRYLLMLSGSMDSSIEYNKFCNMISEYGSLIKVLPTTSAYLAEHCETILAENALKTLSEISKGN